jgi:hypothetical protein
MRVAQAAEIARFLGVPVSDVMNHGGANVRGSTEMQSPESLPVVGWIDGEYRAHLDWSNTDHRIEVLGHYPPTAVCLQYRTAQTKADIVDGWIAVTLPPREPDAEAMLDRYCLVSLKGRSDAMIRLVRRGYTQGRFNLLDFWAPAEHDVELSWFAPILAIKPT